MRKSINTNGLALVEFLFVVACVCILGLIALPYAMEQKDRSAQQSAYAMLQALASYQTQVYSQCGQFTTSAFGNTQNGCKANVVWTPPGNCGNNASAQENADEFEAYSLDQNSYGYLIYFPYQERSSANAQQEKGRDQRIPVVAEATKNIDNDPVYETINIAATGEVYHIHNDLTNISTPAPQVFRPRVARPFNICADPQGESSQLDPKIKP